jgi:hypothetical protein
MLDYRLLFAFQFWGAVWFWMLLSGSGDQLFDPLPALVWRVYYRTPALNLHCLSCVYLMRVHCWVYLLAPPPFSGVGSVFHPSPLLSVFDYSSLFVFQFYCGEDQSAQGCNGLCSQRVVRGFLCGAWCSSVCCVNWHAGRFAVSSGGGGKKWCQIFSMQHGVRRISTG